ncbi:MAG TPA: PEP-CTERM sorting domain-containing protein [Vicinamibacterales bacterium]|nr:PEP-CTERM sorting domain-containing protein [Vicinamibacterales bacterium]
MSRLLSVLIALGVLAGSGAATAAPLVLGDNTLTGTTVALRPELAGLIVEDLLVPYDFTGTGGEHVFGQVQNRVVLSGVDGTYDFYWRIIPDPQSSGGITALRLAGFGGLALDGDFRTDGLGTVGPDIARVLSGGGVNFVFSGDGVGPNETSYFFFLDTQATSYARVGVYDLLCAPSGCVSPSFATFAPVPEPGTCGLLGLGAGTLLLSRRKRSSAAVS